jgi:hypothetical protein
MADAFYDEVDAYPAIAAVRRQKQACTIVASAGPEVESIPSGMLAATLLRNTRHEDFRV